MHIFLGHTTASIPPAAPKECPIMDLMDEIFILYACSPNTDLIASVSILSFSCVLVPWALM